MDSIKIESISEKVLVVTIFSNETSTIDKRSIDSVLAVMREWVGVRLFNVTAPEISSGDYRINNWFLSDNGIKLSLKKLEKLNEELLHIRGRRSFLNRKRDSIQEISSNISWTVNHLLGQLSIGLEGRKDLEKLCGGKLPVGWFSSEDLKEAMSLFSLKGETGTIQGNPNGVLGLKILLIQEELKNLDYKHQSTIWLDMLESGTKMDMVQKYLYL
jgi:hypothetical protein